jgi:hypothetical protein
LFAVASGVQGCLEPLPFPPYNHGPTSNLAALCRLGGQSNGNVVGYGCPRKS